MDTFGNCLGAIRQSPGMFSCIPDTYQTLPFATKCFVKGSGEVAATVAHGVRFGVGLHIRCQIKSGVGFWRRMLYFRRWIRNASPNPLPTLFWRWIYALGVGFARSALNLAVDSALDSLFWRWIDNIGVESKNPLPKNGGEDPLGVALLWTGGEDMRAPASSAVGWTGGTTTCVTGPRPRTLSAPAYRR